jgi:hypothetical protein
MTGWRREVRSTRAAGLDSVGRAYELIAEGTADVMIADATDAPILPISVSCFDAIKATSLRWLPVRNEILPLTFWVPRTTLCETALSLKLYLRTTQGGKRTLNQVESATDMTGSTSRSKISAKFARQPTLPTAG